ncbi:MAG TPA: MFS transporter [Bryobacteraceae bacterium]|nr:MFS transporter [Bryobacteraceae bacterium]
MSFFTDISSEMLYPIIPIFLTSTLGATPAIVGVIEGFAESTASILKLFSGWFSDRLGIRRPIVLAGYGLAAATRPLLALAHAWPLVLTARVLDRFAKGVRTAPRDAMIADSTAPEFRGRAFGFHRSLDQMGAVIGPLLALPLLAYFHQDFRSLFLVAFLPAVVSTALVLLARETRRPPRRSGVPLHLEWGGMSPAFRRLVLSLGLFALTNSSDAFIILRARQLGATTFVVVLMFSLYNLFSVLSAWPAGVLSDRIDRSRVLVGGLTIFGLAYLGFALAPSSSWFWFLFPLYGVYAGFTDGVARALVVDLVPMEKRGTALGMHAAVVGIAALPASIIAGVIWQRLGPAAPFYTGAVGAAVTAVLLLLFPGRRSAP